MTFKQALTVLLTAFWVFSQSVMVFAHSSPGAPVNPVTVDGAAIGTVGLQGSNADCLAHKSAPGGGHVDDADAPAHEHGVADVCCNAVCSVAAKFSIFQITGNDVVRIYDPVDLATPKVARPGLPTPPPDTTI